MCVGLHPPHTLSPRPPGTRPTSTRPSGWRRRTSTYPHHTCERGATLDGWCCAVQCSARRGPLSLLAARGVCQGLSPASLNPRRRHASMLEALRLRPGDRWGAARAPGGCAQRGVRSASAGPWRCWPADGAVLQPGQQPFGPLTITPPCPFPPGSWTSAAAAASWPPALPCWCAPALLARPGDQGRAHVMGFGRP